MRARPEITGRGPGGGSGGSGAPATARGPPATPRAGKSVAEFCVAYNICRSTFDNWQRHGVGPVVLQPIPGGRKLITNAAEEAWLRARRPRKRTRRVIANPRRGSI